jgi:DNA-binding beta-propeller fold protein YncE
VANTFSPQVEDRGVDWLSWGSDSCTLRYTSEGSTVFQFDVCNGTQLAPFATGLPDTCFESAPLSDGLLVACSSSIIRLDGSGNITQTYPSPSGAMLFALAAQPNGSTFWVADYNGGASTVYEIDLSSGATVTSFTPTSEYDVAGLTIAP